MRVVVYRGLDACLVVEFVGGVDKVLRVIIFGCFIDDYCMFRWI